MPTYQYRCTECGRELEVVQKFTDPALTECESCHGALRKVYKAVGVVFKGSGFYRTDSRKPETNGASTGTKSAEKSDKSDKGEKAPAASSGSGEGSGSKSDGSGGKKDKAASASSSTAA